MSLAQLFYLKETFRARMRHWRQGLVETRARRRRKPGFTLEALEARVLLSATPTAVAAAQPLVELAPIIVPPGSQPSLDVGLNGQADALTDGLTIMRYLFGFTGAALTSGVIDPMGQRTDPTEITAYLDGIRPALDVDLNGQVDALTDGLAIMRGLFGFTGETLTSGVIDPNGQRTDPDVIAAYLDNMNPGRERVPPVITAALQQDSGLNATDTITSDPTFTGTITDINPIASFTAGVDDEPVSGFTDVLSNLQSTGVFTLSTARLNEITGGTLADGTHSLHLQAADARGNVTTLDRTFVLDTTPPSVRTGIDAVLQGIQSITLTWQAATDDSGITGYSVERSLGGAPFEALTTTTALSVTDSSLTLGMSHQYRVTAIDAAGNVSDWSQLSESIVPRGEETNVFRNETLASGFHLPTAMTFLPDGRLLVTELGGTIDVLEAPYQQIDPTPFLLLANVGTFEVQGIFDVAIDPNFEVNHYYYISYTAGTPNHDRISRFTADASLTGTDPDTELVLYEDPNDAGPDHHGGAIMFGNDGKLYFTTGENFDPPASQDLTNPRGKVHRINSDGTVPTDDPFYDGDGPNWDSIWALGLRNPFRAYYDSATGRMLIGDVGGNDYSTAIEEVDIGIRGANYGWPNVEAPDGNPLYTAPAYYYPHDGRDASITGGFVYHGTQFPSSYQGSYFFADYTQNWIRRLTFDEHGTVTSVFNFLPPDGSLDGPYGDIVCLAEGPDGALYYLDIGVTELVDPGVGRLRRIEYVQANQPAVVAATADPTAGMNPLTVTFSSAGTFDPENSPLTFLWTFGDGDTSTDPDPQHTYAQAGQYQARLSVSDGVNTTVSAPIAIAAGNKPVITLVTTPSDGELFRAGDVISFSGSATDVEDGTLPASAFTWDIDFLHEDHVHPAVPIAGITSGTFVIPTTGHDFSGFTRYRITLTVTDSDGLQTVQSAIIFPEKVNLTFDSSPGGRTLYLDGIAHAAPFVYDTLIGFQHQIEAPGQSDGANLYTFDSWSDGGAQSHQIVVPDADTNYVATYQVTPLGAAALTVTQSQSSPSASQIPPITDDAELAPLVLPSEGVIQDAASPAVMASPADVLTNVASFRSDPRFQDINGKDTTVVIIDTGIDVDHPLFGPDTNHDGVADRIVYQWDFADNDADASDRMGHGSHIASVIGSADTAYPGVAPDTKLIALKVFKDSGEGNFGFVDQALQWVAAHAVEYHIDVVNLSLGDGQNWTTPGAHYGLGEDFATLANDGIIVVAAAGNNFFLSQSTSGVAYPAADPNVIGVGAVWTQDFGGPWRWSSGAIDFTTGADRIASFSQRDAAMTEIFAPGARLTGANQSGGTATMQGTSQSAAYLSGTALLAQDLAHEELGRSLTPQEFASLIRQTGQRIVDGDDEQDNVVNTGMSFQRVDMEQLAEGILALADAAPVAANDRYRTVEDKTLVRSGRHGLLANDTDVDGQTLTAMLVSGPSHGTLVLNSDGGFIYRPAADYSGSDSFTYKASDGMLYSNVATVALTIHHRERHFPVLFHHHGLKHFCDRSDWKGSLGRTASSPFEGDTDTDRLLAQSFIQQEWVKNFVTGTDADEGDDKELFIALPG